MVKYRTNELSPSFKRRLARITKIPEDEVSEYFLRSIHTSKINLERDLAVVILIMIGLYRKDQKAKIKEERKELKEYKEEI